MAPTAERCQYDSNTIRVGCRRRSPERCRLVERVGHRATRLAAPSTDRPDESPTRRARGTFPVHGHSAHRCRPVGCARSTEPHSSRSATQRQTPRNRDGRTFFLPPFFRPTIGRAQSTTYSDQWSTPFSDPDAPRFVPAGSAQPRLSHRPSIARTGRQQDLSPSGSEVGAATASPQKGWARSSDGGSSPRGPNGGER